MKRYFALIAAAALLLTGCQSGKESSVTEDSSSTTSSVEQTTSSDDTSTESTPVSEPDVITSEAQTAETSAGTDSVAFQTGVWRGNSAYFLFYADGTGGATRDFENGIGVPFEYEYGDGNIVFHMGSADDNTTAALTDVTEERVTLTWEDGTEEDFRFVSSDPDGFQFYSNEELEPIARRFYQSNNPDARSPEFADVKTNDDGYAVVQLYDMDGENVMTAAWYMINRVTLTGSDGLTGSAVNMSGFAEEAAE